MMPQSCRGCKGHSKPCMQHSSMLHCCSTTCMHTELQPCNLPKLNTECCTAAASACTRSSNLAQSCRGCKGLQRAQRALCASQLLVALLHHLLHAHRAATLHKAAGGCKGHSEPCMQHSSVLHCCITSCMHTELQPCNLPKQNTECCTSCMHTEQQPCTKLQGLQRAQQALHAAQLLVALLQHHLLALCSAPPLNAALLCPLSRRYAIHG